MNAPHLVDIGVNLTNRSFDHDRERVLERASAAGVRTLVITGTTEEGSREAQHMARARPGLFATAGVHPHHAKDCGPSTIEVLRGLAKDGAVAIGECGLDFNRNFSPVGDQELWFERQLELAAELQLPVFMHERDASARFAELVARHRSKLVRGVVHCFTGTREELDRYLSLDLHIGITGWICDERRGKHLLEVVREIPLDRLMLETDAPYLLPRTLKVADRRNEPAFLTSVLSAVARAVDRSEEEIARVTTETAQKFFALPR
jgi:TatD DNase family protein